MATRSRIAIANPNGTFTSIHCNWDGYPCGVGVALRDHYKDAAKVSALIAKGNRATLDEEITNSYQDAPRDNTNVDAQASADFPALCELTQESGGKYLYVFKGGEWFCAKGSTAFFGLPANKAPQFLESIDEVLRQSTQIDI